MKRFFLFSSLLLASLTLAASIPSLRQRVFNFTSAAQTQSVTTQRSTPPRRAQQPLENFDIRADLDRSLASPPSEGVGTQERRQSETAVQEMLAVHPRTKIQWSSLTGTPSRITNLTEALTQPRQGAADIAGRRFLKEQRALFRLLDEEVDNLAIRRQDRTQHNGLTHLTYEQQVTGIDIFQGRFAVHLDRRGSVVAANGELMPEATSRVNRTTPTLSNIEALRLAAQAVEKELIATIAPRAESNSADRKSLFGVVPNLSNDTSARLVYFPLTSKSLRLAWEFTLWMQDTPDVYLVIIDAERGTLLFRHNYTTYENPHGLVYTGDSPRPDVPHVSDNPPFVDRQDVPFNGAPYFPANDKHFDWWNGQSQTTLISNNTDTHLDRTGGVNVPDDPRLAVPDSNFSFPVDFTQAPTTENNQKAAQVNLFYWINRYHDILYSYGFTETAGNFQTDNFGLGGVGNDAIQADAQDGSGTNNANFSTPPDGSAGRVQMYLWTYASPQLDGDFDQGVILHELTHGLSNRLIGNGAGLSTLQARGMGEGWSDYFGLALMRKAGDNVDAQYPVGQYVRNNYALGIRRYPYSTDKSVNPLTFANIALNTEVHRIGEIWCMALWEMRAALIKQHGFTEGQRQSIQLVVDALKLTPGEPTFLDARDALLLADRINNSGANQCLIWQAFAKRGMGLSASTTNSSDTAPKEAFDAPAYCSDAGTLSLDRRNYLVGENMRISVADRNAGSSAQVTLTSSVTGDQETLVLAQEAVYPGSYQGLIRIAAGKANSGDGSLQASVEAGAQITVRYNDQNTGAGAGAQITATASTAYEKTIFRDDVEQGNQGWIPGGSWGIVTNKSASPSHSWTDTPGGSYSGNTNFSLTSPLLDCSNLNDITLYFAHSYQTENGFDYGIVEYSTDDGSTWQRASAYTGTQSSFAQAILKLDGLNNQARARVRFRLQIDPYENADGWYVDDVRITGRSANPAIVNPSEQRAPQILAISPAFGPLAGGTTVTISGANFTETTDTSVTFGGLSASAINVISNSTLSAVVPAHAAGAVVVRVKNKYGEASLSNGFLYYQNGSATQAPILGQIFPSSGSTRGGLNVTLTGANFTPETTVKFGSLPAIVTFVNANTVRALSPVAGATGTVDVSATNGANTANLPGVFTYTAPTPPTIQVITPTTGQTALLNNLLSISWNSTDNQAVAKHRISLLRDTTVVADFATDVPGNLQSFNWLVPATQTQATNYRIRVVATDDEGAEAEGFSGTFAISPTWQAQTSMPSALLRTLIASDGQYLYVIGGRSTAASSTATNAVRRFDPANNSWTTLASLPMLLSSGEAVQLNGKIYVLGGQTETTAISTVYIYDIAANSWTTGANAPIGASAYAIGVDSVRGIIYVTGGLDSQTNPLTNVNAYDTKTNTWSLLASMKTARYAHEAAFIDGKLYVAGGTGVAGGLSSGEVYDPATQQWNNIASLNRPRGFAASTPFKDAQGNAYWFVVGGQDTSTVTTIGTAELYDVRNNRWTTLSDAFNLLTPRTQINGTTVSDYFYVAGGGTGSASQPTSNTANERIKLPITPNSTGTAPILAVPPTQIAIVGSEIVFTVTANDLNSTVPLSLTATGLPAGATFTTTIATNNSTKGTFRWTPTNADTGRSFTISFSGSDGSTTETRKVIVNVVTAADLAIVNAASYRRDFLSSDSIASAFGENLAIRTESAFSLPLPTDLAGTQVFVNGIPASLLYVSPTQVNFILPPNLSAGPATIIVSNPKGNYAMGLSQVTPSAPAIFTADASGRGDAAALATIDGVNYLPAPFPVTVNGKQNILALFGTGFRHASALSPGDENGVAESIRVTIDGIEAPVLFAGAQGQYVGLDQINVAFPASLQAGTRRVELILTLNGVEANRVTILLQ
ncbi:MAG: M36 family metallopeptidase [Acidobacteria bacterium]|nr:M36 family metallopeptidase [Acidobacteriota bacterium]